jgi:hypothetical protein
MKKFAILAVLFMLLATPSFCKSHTDTYPVACTVLWPAVKDVLRNSGKYGIIGIDNTEMSSSFNIGGTLGGKRINSVVLTAKGNTCEMQVQTAYSGLAHNDYGDFKKRVDEALAKMQAQQPPPAAEPKKEETAPPKN